MGVVSLGPGLIALSPEGAAASAYDLLYLAFVNTVVTGDERSAREVVELVRIIEGWRCSTNPDERRAYKIFMRSYGRYYRKVRKWLAQSGLGNA